MAGGKVKIHPSEKQSSIFASSVALLHFLFILFLLPSLEFFLWKSYTLCLNLRCVNFCFKPLSCDRWEKPMWQKSQLENERFSLIQALPLTDCAILGNWPNYLGVYALEINNWFPPDLWGEIQLLLLWPCLWEGLKIQPSRNYWEFIALRLKMIENPNGTCTSFFMNNK